MRDAAAHRVGLIVSCLMPEEEMELLLEDERGAAARAGIDFVRASIVDMSVPAEGSVEPVLRAIGRCTIQRPARRRALPNGSRPVASRRGGGAGVGGGAPEDACERIGSARELPVPETDDQREWLATFAERYRRRG